MEKEFEALVLNAPSLLKGQKRLELINAQGRHLVWLSQFKAQAIASGQLCTPFHRIHVKVRMVRGWDYLVEGHLLEDYQGLRNSYRHIEVAQMMRRCMMHATQIGLPCPALYATFLAHIRLLTSRYPPQPVGLSFLAKLLLAEGLMDFEGSLTCEMCAAAAEELWHQHGQWRCNLHRNGGIYWSHAALEGLRWLLKNRNVSDMAEIDLPALDDGKLLQLVESYWK